MFRVFKNALRNPRLFAEAAHWLGQKYLLQRAPIRRRHGVDIGRFVDFSEFHGFAGTVSDAEHDFLARTDFGPGAMIDVGANLGLFSLILAQHHQNRIIAFEPGESTFAALEANVQRNGGGVECHRLALAETDGEVRFAMLDRARANSSLATGEAGISVPARRLDTIVRDLGVERIALLKIDTEGFETTVLRGARRC